MFGALIRLVLVVVLLVGAAAFFFGYRWGGTTVGSPASAPVVGTSGTGTPESHDRAREVGANIGAQVATGAERAGDALGEARLTAKVKSKIALDDTLKGSDVSVHTAGDTVTLEGRVTSAAQHQRVVQLTRETAGVGRVIDHVTVK